MEIVGDCGGEIMSDGKVTLHANTASSIAARDMEMVGSTLLGNVIVRGCVKLDNASSVTGNIRADSVESSGAIKGNLAAQGNIMPKEHAGVLGDIKTATLSAERGVRINGKVDMSR